eukprot:m.230372 g.230372  ORF g.230372 m.230372 type:complete len:468 (+) comp19257_c0_seq6:275-1678(+)
MESAREQQRAGNTQSQIARKVFHKTSRNNKIKAYILKRDFYDYGGNPEPIEGAVAVDPERNLHGKALFVRLNVIFSHTLADTGAILGLPCSTVLYTETQVLYNSSTSGSLDEAVKATVSTSKLQKTICRRSTWPALPFTFRLPAHLPASVIMQNSKGRAHPGQHLGVDYEVLVYLGRTEQDEQPSARSLVNFNIRKLYYASEIPDATPNQVVTERRFGISSKTITLRVMLDKNLYHAGDVIDVTVDINNMSTKTVKGIRIAVRQHVILNNADGEQQLNTKATLACVETVAGCPIKSGSAVVQSFQIPVFEDRFMHQAQIALDGQLHDEDTGLAASTTPGSMALTTATPTATSRSSPAPLLSSDHASTMQQPAVKIIRGGIVVHYEVKVKVSAVAFAFSSTVACKVPFLLLHRKEDSRKLSIQVADDVCDTAPVDDVGDMEFSEEPTLVFEEFLSGRAEKFFADESES